MNARKVRKERKRVQCPYCIYTREEGYRIAAHINSAHPEKVEEWIKAA